MDDEAMEAFLRDIQDQDQDEDDEDWVLDDEFSVRNHEQRRDIGSIGDLLASMQDPRMPPSPDETPQWVSDLLQDDPRYGEKHNRSMEIIHRLEHKTGDSHSITFLDQMNRGYEQRAR